MDRTILRVLKNQGRISNAALARTVGLSESATLERVRRLESAGTILGYAARVQPEAINRGSAALVEIRFKGAVRRQELIQQVLALPDVEFCASVMGRCDLVLHVTASDTAALSACVDDNLRSLEGMEVVNTLVLSELHRS